MSGKEAAAQPPKRNGLAVALRAFKASKVRPKRGKGSYTRKGRGEP